VAAAIRLVQPRHGSRSVGGFYLCLLLLRPYSGLFVEHLTAAFVSRRSFAFSHSANRQRQQQPVEDIETGQVSTAGQRADNDDCLPRAADLASATSAPDALRRQSVQSATDSVMPASPPHLQTRSSTLSNGAASPAASPTAQVSSAAMLGRLLSVGNKGLKRSPSGTQPVCLICLENLTPEDFEVHLLLVLTFI